MSSTHQKHAEPSKLMVSPPSLGISIENKTKVLSTTNICRQGPDNFPKIAESGNLSDKLGIPVNTLRQSVMTLIKPRQGVSMSYKDALLIKAAPENPSAEVLILEWLQELHPGYNSQESRKDNSGKSKRKQRSQHKKLIHSVSIRQTDRPDL